MRDLTSFFANVPVNRTLGFTLRQGRTLGVCQVEVEQGERKVALATFTYLFFELGGRE